MKKIVLAAALGLFAVPSVAVANQMQPVGGYTVVIPIRDLDLATADGIAALRQRANVAAADICLADVRPLRSRLSVNDCREDFMKKVERRIQLASAQSPKLASR
jgi:UrcA family protein